MGADGGTIAKRSDTIKQKKKAEKLDLSLVERARWANCALSNTKLVDPIVADRVGNLFNKEALVRALLEKRMPDGFRHVRSLRDVSDVHFHANPDASAAEETPYICPVALVPVGVLPFVLMLPCGHVVSERALRELSDASHCASCSAPTTSSLRLNLPKAEYDIALATLLATIDAEKAAKAAAKAAKRSTAADVDQPNVKKSRKLEEEAVEEEEVASTTTNAVTHAFSTESAAFKSLFISAKIK